MEDPEDNPLPSPRDDESDADAKTAAEPIAPETAQVWLASLRPASLLALLREPDFALIAMSAFSGFRVNAGGYANPLVRRRLAQAIQDNEAFAARVRTLAEQRGDTASRPNPQSAASPANPKPLPPARVRDTEGKELRERLRRERDEARSALAEAERARASAETALRDSEAARTAETKRAQQQAHRVSRLERQIQQLKSEQTSLVKALRQDKVAPPRRASPSHAAASDEAQTPPPAPWREAVIHLLHKDKSDMVLILALDVLRSHPENVSALDIAAQAYARQEKPREAAEMLRALFAAQLQRGAVAPASETLITRLLPLLPPPPDAKREVHAWLASLRSGGQIAVGRAVAERLRHIAPEAYAWLHAEVRGAMPPLADQLMPPPGALGPDAPLPLTLPGEWTARRVAEAVNANAEHSVTQIREALTHLNDETARGVWNALSAASEGDESVLAPLRRAPRGPVVVDGSNAAWFDQQSYATPRARLQSILELRRTLRRRGFFPVLLFADAPLPYTIDDPATLRAMLGRQEIALVDSGVDADEVLLREAKRWNAPLVTNDYMTDWDPRNEVPKIQYTISLNGEAHLVS